MGGSCRSCRGRPSFSFAILRPMGYSPVTKMLRRGEDVKRSEAFAFESVDLHVDIAGESLESGAFFEGQRQG